MELPKYFYFRVKSNAKGTSVTLEDASHVDVVEVVHCADCKHSYESLCGRVCSYGVCVDCEVDDEFFCAYGEKGR